MAAKRSRSKLSFLKSKPSRKRKKGTWQNTILNAVIGGFSLLVLVFIYSFSQRTSADRVTIPTLTQTPPKLAAEAYEENPILDIEVEVLNGCGEQGIAARMSDFLRTHQIDVVRSENANSFDYTRTQVISRNENVEALKKVAGSLGFDIRDKSRVRIEPTSDADVDVTVIVGKDFNSISPVVEYLKTLF
ncbi:MAG: LytR C-terminal domain-containing protein [FCB group bacterium]|nr:LytR C-terminal domain-containing protein [FCB group bacterium]